jgi:hypothetical protein
MELQLSTFLQAAINLTGADMGTAQIAFGNRLRLVGGRGFKDDFLSYFEHVEAGATACGVALASGAPVIVEDVCASPCFVGRPSFDVMLRAGVRSCVSVPIATDGRVLGKMSTHRRTAGAPSLTELDRLRWLAREAAALLEGTASGLSWRAIEVLARG